MKKMELMTLIFSVLLCGWFVQTTLILNSDVSWLMLATKRLLAGGTYTKDFFEVNPPLILYLYIPSVLLTTWFSLSALFALRIYILFLSGMSLFLCYFLLKKNFSSHEKNLSTFFLLVITAIFLLMPLSEFGQREHFLVILCLPYFLLVGNRSQHLPCRVRILIGLFLVKRYQISDYCKSYSISAAIFSISN